MLFSVPLSQRLPPVLLSVLHRENLSQVHIASAKVANVLRAALRRGRIDPGDMLDGSFDHPLTHRQITEELVDAGLEAIHRERVGDGYGVAVARSRPDIATEATRS